MTTTTIRVSTKTRDALNELARTAGVPMQQVLEQAIETYRRQRLLAEANAAYAALREDAAAWDDLASERAAWDATLSDGLERR
jgi:predicted transcriptional regulator